MRRSRSVSSRSDDASPRRRLELDDDCSQSVPLSSEAPNTTGAVRYDADDHTAQPPRGVGRSHHMMLLPHAFISPNRAACAQTHPSHSSPSCFPREEDDPHRSPSAPAAAISLHAPNGVSLRAAHFVSGRTLDAECAFVRLPHPRHGEASLFVCPPLRNSAMDGAEAETGREMKGAHIPLWEVQAQKPPGGFGQTWFINDAVEPNEELLLVTPVDITFFALRQAVTHAMRDKFVSAEDLIMGATRRAAPRRGESDWAGWGVALAQCPALAPAMAAMQSHSVLSRICEERCVGGDYYYRWSAEKMGVWLREKVQRVSNCQALRTLLQLPETENGAAVPTSVSFGVVAEYVVEEVADVAAKLCGSGTESETE